MAYLRLRELRPGIAEQPYDEAMLVITTIRQSRLVRKIKPKKKKKVTKVSAKALMLGMKADDQQDLLTMFKSRMKQ